MRSEHKVPRKGRRSRCDHASNQGTMTFGKRGGAKRVTKTGRVARCPRYSTSTKRKTGNSRKKVVPEGVKSTTDTGQGTRVTY